MAYPRQKGYRGVGMEGIIAKWYARNVARDLEDYRRGARLVADHAPTGARVLELAPGPGDLSIELAKLGPFVVTGLDISRAFVQIARDKAARAGVAVDFQHGDAADMPFPAESVDVIVCRAAFKNFSHPVRALDEMHRVLALDGRGLIIDLRPDAPRAAIHDHVDRMHLGPVSSVVTKWMLHGVLRRWARSAGQLRELVAQSAFERCDIVESPIGYEVWLTKSAPRGGGVGATARAGFAAGLGGYQER